VDLKETGFEDADWIHLDQNRDQCRVTVNLAVDFPVP
jgi:hypothetical protein